MNRKLMTILAGLSTAAAFAVNGSDWLHGGSASAGKLCVSAVFIVLVSLPFSVFLVPFFGVTNFMTSTAAAMFLPTAVSVVWLIVAVGNWIHNWKNV